jgi:hypothetical protein
MGIGYKGPFPETQSRSQGFEAPGYIGSSEAAGAGHEQYDGRDAIDNHNFPNEESGEGQDGTCGSEGSGLMPGA